MKRLIILSLVLFPFFSACNKDNETGTELEIREIAWKSLDSQDKSTVNIDWTQAPIGETTYEQKDVYSVMFNTDQDALLGPIVVYIDKSNLIVIGRALRI